MILITHAHYLGACRCAVWELKVHACSNIHVFHIKRDKLCDPLTLKALNFIMKTLEANGFFLI